MVEEYSFLPLEEEMKKILDKLSGKRMVPYQGKDNVL